MADATRVYSGYTLPYKRKAPERYGVEDTLFEDLIDAIGVFPPHTQNADTILIPNSYGTPAYDDVQDWLNMTRSAGRLTGGVVTAHSPADGTVNITDLEGMIFTANSLGSPIVYFKKAAVHGVSIADDVAVSWIYYDYTTDSYLTTTDRSTIHEYDQFTVARVWRSGNDVEVMSTGHNIYNKDRRSHNRLILKYGNMDHSSGAMLSAHATPLRLSCSIGNWYVANHPYSTAAADTFNVWYKSGGATWLETGPFTLFSEIFNGAAATVYESYQDGNNIGALGANKYGVYWIFECQEGDLYVVMGTATYANIGAAQASSVPSSLPPYCVNWARLIGRAIIKNGGAAFHSVESVFATSFTQSAATDHTSLANLNSTNYTHLTAITAGYIDQDVKVAATPQFARIGIGAVAHATDELTVVGTSTFSDIVTCSSTLQSTAIHVEALTTNNAIRFSNNAGERGFQIYVLAIDTWNDVLTHNGTRWLTPSALQAGKLSVGRAASGSYLLDIYSAAAEATSVIKSDAVTKYAEVTIGGSTCAQSAKCYGTSYGVGSALGLALEGNAHYVVSGTVGGFAIGTNNATPMYLSTNGAVALTLASSGAALFAASVTSTGFVATTGGLNSGGIAADSWYIGYFDATTAVVQFYNVGGTYQTVQTWNDSGDSIFAGTLQALRIGIGQAPHATDELAVTGTSTFSSTINCLSTITATGFNCGTGAYYINGISAAESWALAYVDVNTIKLQFYNVGGVYQDVMAWNDSGNSTFYGHVYTSAGGTFDIGATGTRFRSIFGTSIYAVTHYADHISENTGAHGLVLDHATTCAASVKATYFDAQTGGYHLNGIGADSWNLEYIDANSIELQFYNVGGAYQAVQAWNDSGNSTFYGHVYTSAGGSFNIGATGTRFGSIFGTSIYAVTHYADHISENTGAHGLVLDHATVCSSTLQALRLGIGGAAHATDELTVVGTSTFSDTVLMSSTLQALRIGIGQAPHATDELAVTGTSTFNGNVTLSNTMDLLCATAAGSDVGATGTRFGSIFGTSIYAVTHYADHIAENTGSHGIVLDQATTCAASVKATWFDTQTGGYHLNGAGADSWALEYVDANTIEMQFYNVGGVYQVVQTWNDSGNSIFAGTVQATRLGLGAAPDATAILYTTTAHATAPSAWFSQSDAGDAYIRFALATTVSWSVGIDNSVVGDPFVISLGAGAAVPGTSDKLKLTTAGILGVDHIAELTGAHGLALDHAVTCASTLQALRIGIGGAPHASDELTVTGTSTFSDTVLMSSTLQALRIGIGQAPHASDELAVTGTSTFSSTIVCSSTIRATSFGAGRAPLYLVDAYSAAGVAQVCATAAADTQYAECHVFADGGDIDMIMFGTNTGFGNIIATPAIAYNDLACIQVTNATAVLMTSIQAAPIYFATTNTTRMRISPSEYQITIGNTIPNALGTNYAGLSVGGMAHIFGNLAEGAGGGIRISANAYYDGGASWKAIVTDEVALYEALNGTHTFFVAASVNADSAITWVTALKINANATLTALTTYSTHVGATYEDLYIDNTGLIGHLASSIRFKENIRDLTDTDRIFDLRPVWFQYKDTNIDKMGVIAEEADKVIPELVWRDNKGDISGFDYKGLVVPMLHQLGIIRQVTMDHDCRIAKLEQQIYDLTVELNSLKN